MPTISDKDIRQFLRRKAEEFCEVLTGDPATARQELQKRINKLVLTPRDTPNGSVFEATGDVSMFTTDDVMHTNSLEGIAQHYIAGSIPVVIVLDPSVPLTA